MKDGVEKVDVTLMNDTKKLDNISITHDIQLGNFPLSVNIQCYFPLE